MHFKGLDLNLVVALNALLAHRNVTHAGKALSLSQSAMSGALARLRDHFGDPLLVRVGQEFRLTATAEQLHGPVRSLLAQMEAVFSVRPNFDPAMAEREFVIMSSPYQSMVLLARALGRLGSAGPGISFRITPFSDFPLQSLEQGDVDLLVIAEEHASQDHPYEPLFNDDFVCLCCAESAAIREHITPAQFRTLGHVVARYGTGGVPYNDERFLSSAGCERRVEVVVSSFGELPQYLMGSARIATMHRRLAQEYARAYPLRILPVPIAMPTVRQIMQWHSYKATDPAVMWLREQIAAAAAEVESATIGQSHSGYRGKPF